MKRAKREAAKEAAEALKAHRQADKLYRAKIADDRERTVQAKLAKQNQEAKRGKADWGFFECAVAKKAPKLLDKEYAGAVKLLDTYSNGDGIFKIREWKPEGKGRHTQFVSLANYLLTKYPTPKFLWSAFWELDASQLVPFVIQIARGESFAKICQDKFPLPLTKKQCHAFLQSTAEYTFMSALRKVQIQTYGGDLRLHTAWMDQDMGKRLMANTEEIFWDSVLAWFAKNPMVDLSQLEPLIDYIKHRHLDPAFSMKGRSVLAMFRGMEEWHNELQRVKVVGQHNYKPSGFKEGSWTTKRKENGVSITDHWRIKEVLTSKDLAAEGREMHHCAYSYSKSIADGRVSIWSMTCNVARAVTIEVWNSKPGVISQVRGKFNRQSTAQEFRVLQTWAQENGLEVRIGWW
jgi:hypothetical protein